MVRQVPQPCSLTQNVTLAFSFLDVPRVQMTTLDFLGLFPQLPPGRLMGAVYCPNGMKCALPSAQGRCSVKLKTCRCRSRCRSSCRSSTHCQANKTAAGAATWSRKFLCNAQRLDQLPNNHRSATTPHLYIVQMKAFTSLHHSTLTFSRLQISVFCSTQKILNGTDDRIRWWNQMVESDGGIAGHGDI